MNWGLTPRLQFWGQTLGVLALACWLGLQGQTPAAAAVTPPTVTPPPIAAKAFILVDALSGQVLAEGSEEDRHDPASLTKMMTAYVAFKAMKEGALDPEKPVNVSPRALQAPGARMFLTTSTPVKPADLVKGLVVQAANDAAVALAEAVAGSEEAFVARMNEEARRLGLADTRFVNATGLPMEGHQMSARDAARLALALVRDFPDRYPVFRMRDFTYNQMDQGNRNRLLWTDTTVDGLMTGFAESTGYSIVVSALRGERRLVAVVIGTQTDALRLAEAQKLLNFGYLAYETRRIYKRGQPVAAPAVYKGTRSEAPLGFDHDVFLTLPRDRFTGLTAMLETRQPLVAPLAAGQKAGIMKLMRDNAAVAEFPVVALEDVPVAGFLSRGWDTLRLMLTH